VSRRIGVVGAGVAGLTAAYDLTKTGHAVTLFEAGPVAGGLASGFRAPGWDWPLERFYHHIFVSDDQVIALAQEVGLGDKTFFRRPITALWYKGKAHPFDNYLRAALFPHLPWLDKVRAAPVALYLRFTRNWRPLEKVTAHEWLIRWLGQRGYQILFEPLLIGKFGDAYKEVNMAWMWARIHKRSSRLGYFEGGFQALADALVERIRAQGGSIHFHTPVEAIIPEDGGLTVRVAGQAHDPVWATPVPGSGVAQGETDAHRFDAVIVTVSPALMTRLVPALPGDYLGRLRNLKSLGAVALIVALKHQLTQGFYWINLQKDEGFPFLALVEHTNFIEPSHYGGDHLVYMGDYLPPTHEYFQLSQEELLARFLPALKRFNPDFDPSWVRGSWLFRERYAQPVVPVNYSQDIPDLRTPIPGLFFASMSQVYPWDRGTNYAVELGHKAARLAAGE